MSNKIRSRPIFELLHVYFRAIEELNDIRFCSENWNNGFENSYSRGFISLIYLYSGIILETLNNQLNEDTGKWELQILDYLSKFKKLHPFFLRLYNSFTKAWLAEWEGMKTMMQHGEEIKAKWNAVFAASVSPDADPPQLFLDFGFLNESEQEKTREIIQDVLLEVKICRDIIAHGHTYDGFLKANDSMNFTALRPWFGDPKMKSRVWENWRQTKLLGLHVVVDEMMYEDAQKLCAIIVALCDSELPFIAGLIDHSNWHHRRFCWIGKYTESYWHKKAPAGYGFYRDSVDEFLWLKTRDL